MLTCEESLWAGRKARTVVPSQVTYHIGGFFLFLGGVVISLDMLHANLVFVVCFLPLHCDFMYKDRRSVASGSCNYISPSRYHISSGCGRYWPSCGERTRTGYGIATVFYLVVYVVTHALHHVFQTCSWAEGNHVDQRAPPGVDQEFPNTSCKGHLTLVAVW